MTEPNCAEMKEIVEWVRNNIIEAKEKQKEYYDKNHRAVIYNVGDKVLIRNTQLSNAEEGRMQKLNPTFIGPFKVKKVENEVILLIETLDEREVGKRHVNDVKIFVERNDGAQPPPQQWQNVPPSPPRPKRNRPPPGYYRRLALAKQ